MNPAVAVLLGFVVGLIMPAICLFGLSEVQNAIGINMAHLDLNAVAMNMAVSGLLPISVLLGGILGVLLSLATARY